MPGAGGDPVVLESLTEPVGIVALVGETGPGGRELIL